MTEREEKIESFLKGLGVDSGGKFFVMCGKCGEQDEIGEKLGTKIEMSSYGAYGSEFTGHMWDTINIKCISCGNATSFDR
jgi:hypothetical protein